MESRAGDSSRWSKAAFVIWNYQANPLRLKVICLICLTFYQRINHSEFSIGGNSRRNAMCDRVCFIRFGLVAWKMEQFSVLQRTKGWYESRSLWKFYGETRGWGLVCFMENRNSISKFIDAQHGREFVQCGAKVSGKSHPWNVNFTWIFSTWHPWKDVINWFSCQWG